MILHPQPPFGPPIPGAVPLHHVTPTRTRWLWPGRIPLGRITLLVGDPGVGKSLLALDIAARVSRGGLWPEEEVNIAGGATSSTETRVGEGEGGRGGGPQDTPSHSQTPDSPSPMPNPQAEIPNPQSAAASFRLWPPFLCVPSVLLLTAEDHLADTVRPRLEALGADCTRIVAVSTLFRGPQDDDGPGPFPGRREHVPLRPILDAMPDCRLIIIDPISSYLGDKNENSNAQIRELLDGLAALAQERNVAVLAISHLRKKESAAIYRAMGSMAFVAVARAAWILVKDQADPSRRYFLPLKNNLAPDTAGLAFTIQSAALRPLRPSTDEANTPSCAFTTQSTTTGNIPVLRWETEPVKASVETSLAATRSAGRPDVHREFATQWLKKRLQTGPAPMRDVKDEAHARCISYGTLRRAFQDLGGEAVRESSAPHSRWLWKLP